MGNRENEGDLNTLNRQHREELERQQAAEYRVKEAPGMATPLRAHLSAASVKLRRFQTRDKKRRGYLYFTLSEETCTTAGFEEGSELVLVSPREGKLVLLRLSEVMAAAGQMEVEK